MLAALLLSIAVAADARPLHRLDLPAPGHPGQTLALHCAEPARPHGEAVLFVHGASFPTALAAGFRFGDHDSWMDFMARRGFLACGLDFLGFGDSSRPPAMRAPAGRNPPLDRAPDAAAQIAAAVRTLRARPGVHRLHLVAHSWGTIPAGLFAATHADALDSLTLFGPVVPVAGAGEDAPPEAWWSISARERYRQLRFEQVLPPGMHLLEPAVDRDWARAFAASAPETGGSRDRPIRVPAGPVADIDAVQAGRYPYDPRAVRVPVFIVYGDHDSVVDDAGAASLLARFAHSPLRWRLRIDHATHVMHLERNRRSLYRAVAAFLDSVDGGTP